MNLLINQGLSTEKKFLNIENLRVVNTAKDYSQIHFDCIKYLLSFRTPENNKDNLISCYNFMEYGKEIVDEHKPEKTHIQNGKRPYYSKVIGMIKSGIL